MSEFASDSAIVPRVLIIDDVLGRCLSDGSENHFRSYFCEGALLRDITGDSASHHVGDIRKPPETDKNFFPYETYFPVDAVFCRGQRPASADVGDNVVNDLDDVLAEVESGWDGTRAREDGRRWAMVLVDLNFLTGVVPASSDPRTRGQAMERSASYFGVEIARRIRERWKDVPVAFLSGEDPKGVERERDAIPVLDFMGKGDVTSPVPWSAFRRALRAHGLVADFGAQDGERALQIVGLSLSVLKLLRSARKRACCLFEGDTQRTALPNVLLRGETGTGKELFARFIATQGTWVWPGVDPSARRPYGLVDCGRLTPTLVESELFGHEKNIVDGRMPRTDGLIRLADGGDFFFDEIGALPSKGIDSIVRAIETGEIVRVGGTEVTHVKIRFISATNRRIEGSEDFRQDVLFRFGTEWLELPPLRERLDDLPLIVRHIVQRLRPADPHLGLLPDALAFLQGYAWPGNVRQLNSVIESILHEYPGVGTVHLHHFEDNANLRLVSGSPLVPGAQFSPTPAPTAPSKTCELDDAIEVMESITIGKLVCSRTESVQNRLPRLLEAFQQLLLTYVGASVRLAWRPGGKVAQKDVAHVMEGGGGKHPGSPARLFAGLASHAPSVTDRFDDRLTSLLVRWAGYEQDQSEGVPKDPAERKEWYAEAFKKACQEEWERRTGGGTQ